MKGTSPSRADRVAVVGNEYHDGVANLINSSGRGKLVAILYVGLDLAKNVFAVHGVNESGKPELVRPNVAIASLPPCVIGMVACSGAHQWARLFMAHGHTVHLDAPEVRRAVPAVGQARQRRFGQPLIEAALRALSARQGPGTD